MDLFGHFDNRASQVIKDILTTIMGSAIVGVALSVFTVPNDIAPGGVSGLATALAFISPISVSVWTLMLNVPLLLAAWRHLGARSLCYTLLATVLLSVFISLSDKLLPHYTSNPLLASLYGGVFSGMGMGFLFVRGISTGGTDLLVLMVKKWLPNMPNGTLLMIVDTTVVAIAVLIFREIDVALYSAITIYVTSKVIDAIAQGFDYAKVIYTITDRGSEVSSMLNKYTDRGTTVLPATGGYTGKEKQMVITVTRRNVLNQTLKLIKTADPDSFTFVTDSTEVHGEGFKVD